MVRLRPLLVAVVLAAAGCSGDHRILDPKGPEARRIAGIGWFMIISASVITVGVFIALLVAIFRRRRTDDLGEPRRRLVKEQTWIVAGGVVLPTVFILVLTGLSLGVLRRTPDSGALHVTVTGHQYWWEIEYPELGVTTANEVHIPSGRDVVVDLRSDDVIHSFWVPDLSGKIDMIPGQTNRLTINADHPGEYRGQCAEFCGLQHAFMIFTVTADDASGFDRWIDAQRQGAATSSDPAALRGASAFQELPCAKCHTIKGTAAHGDAGPDLTHFGSRTTIGAGTVPNTRGYLGGWIADAQAVKPGNLMPPIPMSPDQLNDLIVYLQSLR